MYPHALHPCLQIPNSHQPRPLLYRTDRATLTFLVNPGPLDVMIARKVILGWYVRDKTLNLRGLTTSGDGASLMKPSGRPRMVTAQQLVLKTYISRERAQEAGASKHGPYRILCDSNTNMPRLWPDGENRVVNCSYSGDDGRVRGHSIRIYQHCLCMQWQAACVNQSFKV